MLIRLCARRLAQGSSAHVELAQRLAGLVSHLGDHTEADTLLREATVAAYKDSRWTIHCAYFSSFYH